MLEIRSDRALSFPGLLTPIVDRLTPAAPIRLSRHEIACSVWSQTVCGHRYCMVPPCLPFFSPPRATEDVRVCFLRPFRPDFFPQRARLRSGAEKNVMSSHRQACRLPAAVLPPPRSHLTSQKTSNAFIDLSFPSFHFFFPGLVSP